VPPLQPVPAASRSLKDKPRGRISREAYTFHHRSYRLPISSLCWTQSAGSQRRCRCAGGQSRLWRHPAQRVFP